MTHHHRPRPADALSKVSSDLVDLFTPIYAKIELLEEQNRALLSAMNLHDPQPRGLSSDDLARSLDEMDESRRQHDRILLERVTENSAHTLTALVQPLLAAIEQVREQLRGIEQRLATLERIVLEQG